MGEPDDVEELKRPLSARTAAAFGGEQHRHLHILPGGQIGQKVPRVVLPYKAHRITLVFYKLVVAEPEQVEPVHVQPPSRRPVKSPYHVQESALSAAAVAYDRHKLAAPDPCVQTLKGHDLSFLGLVYLYKIVAEDDAVLVVIGHFLSHRPPSRIPCRLFP
jgi:hypothetical protein